QHTDALRRDGRAGGRRRTAHGSALVDRTAPEPVGASEAHVTAAPLLEFQAIGKEFQRSLADPPVVAIEDISFTLGAKEFVSVIGPSGCGKTTLLRLVAKMLQPSWGSLAFHTGEKNDTTGF